MIGELITCQNDGCEIEFRKRTHNQRYHDDECCRLATNAKIMQKYYARRAQKLGHTRLCADCEKTKLSRYNPETICYSCSLKRETKRNQELVSKLTSVDWN